MLLAVVIKEFLEEIRRSLSSMNQSILEHPYLVEAEDGRLPIEKVKLFAENQHYIVYHDLRSLSLMVTRSTDRQEAEYFSRLLQGDIEAFASLKKLCDALEIKAHRWEEMRIVPEAVSYTHFLNFLALHANPGEQAFSIVVNLPVWSRACFRLGRALRERYGLKETSFFDSFVEMPSWIEEEGLEIASRYLERSEARMRHFARMIQSYEKSFWDGIYSYGR